MGRTIYTPNEIIINDNFAEIVLYNKYGIEINKTFINLKNIEKCSKLKWHLKKSNGNKVYVMSKLDGKRVYLHRFLLNIDPEDDREVDHIDGNTLNNREENLRVCSHTENVWNKSKLLSSNKSGVTGVFWQKQIERWRVQITCNKKVISIGCFINIEDAIRARKEAEKIYFGEYMYKGQS